MDKIKASNRKNIAFIALILIGAILIFWFGFRSVRSVIRLQRTGIEHSTTDVELIRGWMTIPYIARAYQVPEDYLYQALGIQPVGHQKKSLADLNRELAPGKPGEILTVVKASILRYQAEHPGTGTGQ